MAAIQNMDDIIKALQTQMPISFLYNSITSVTNSYYSGWTCTGTPGAGATPASGAGAACNGSTTGAFYLPTLASGQSAYLMGLNLLVPTSFAVFFYDRLVATSGLSGTVTTAQTVSSAALTRNTTGAGVELWLEWYTATGATAVNVTVSYTNSSGTSGRTSISTQIVSSTAAFRMLRLPLQAGDQGVQSVQSVTLSASTLTAGNFGVTLMKKIATVPSNVNSPNNLNCIDLGCPKLYDFGGVTPCIFPVFFTAGTATGVITGDFLIATY